MAARGPGRGKSFSEAADMVVKRSEMSAKNQVSSIRRGLVDPAGHFELLL